MTSFWTGRALLPEGVARGVVLDGGEDGRLASVRTGVERPPPGAVALGGLVLPGLVDAHSHAFHRALRGRAAGGDFWAWRSGM
jgi:cytosine/adenosine deaminase-related metal-dependent hydrolase